MINCLRSKIISEETFTKHFSNIDQQIWQIKKSVIFSNGKSEGKASWELHNGNFVCQGMQATHTGTSHTWDYGRHIHKFWHGRSCTWGITHSQWKSHCMSKMYYKKSFQICMIFFLLWTFTSMHLADAFIQSDTQERNKSTEEDTHIWNIL